MIDINPEQREYYMFPPEIDTFLSKNGFTYDPYDMAWENDRVVIQCDRIRDEHYHITDKKDRVIMYSPTLQIYWLLGYLLWNGYISKNFNV